MPAVVPVNTDVATATQVDLRRLNLLAHLTQAAPAGSEVDPTPAAQALAASFPALPSALTQDLEALQASGLIAGLDDTSLGGPPTVAVTENGRRAVDFARSQVESNRDACSAAVGPLVLRFLVAGQRHLASTEALTEAGLTLFAGPLPEHSVERAASELKELGLIKGQRVAPDVILVPTITAEGRDCLYSSRPVLARSDSTTGAPTYSMTFGNITGGAVSIGNSGNVHQDVTVTIDQATTALRIALDALRTAVDDDEAAQVDAVIATLDEADDTGRKSLLARAASQAKRLATIAATKGVEVATATAVTAAATHLMGVL